MAASGACCAAGGGGGGGSSARPSEDHVVVKVDAVVDEQRAVEYSDDHRDDGDSASTWTCTSTCSSVSDGEVPDGVRAVLGAAVDTVAASAARVTNIDTVTVKHSSCQIGNSMHVHGPLTVVVSPKAVAAATSQGVVLSAASLGFKGAPKEAADEQGPFASTPTTHRNDPAARPQYPWAVLGVAAAGLAVLAAVLAVLLLGRGSGGGPSPPTPPPNTPPTAPPTAPPNAPPTAPPTAPPQTPIPLPHGVQYVPKSLWGGRPAKTAPVRLFTPVDTVIVCHTGTAGCTSLASCSERVIIMQNYHMVDRDFDDISYNFMVGGDGRVYEGRGWDGVGAFLKGWNSRALGLAVIGSFKVDLPSAEQRQTLAGLLQYGVDLGKIKPEYRLVGACQLQSTESPGTRFMQDLKTWGHWWDYGAEKCVR